MNGFVLSKIRSIPFVMKSIYSFCRFGMRLASFGIYTHIESGLNLSGWGYIYIGQRVYIERNAKLWAVSLYGNKKFSPCIIIGDNTRIAQNFHCTCAQKVEIGRGVSITANCGVFDIIHPYDNIEINPRVADIKTCPVVIGDDCMIGMNSTILPGVVLGRHCVVGANSVVTKGDYPDYSVLAGVPAKIIKRYDLVTKTWIKVLYND